MTIPFAKVNKVGDKVGDKVGVNDPLNRRRQQIISEMRDNPNVTIPELKKILGISETAVEKNIAFLKENGYIERVGSKKAMSPRWPFDFRPNTGLVISKPSFHL